MKVLIISLSVIGLLFILVYIYSIVIQRGIETYPYIVEQKYDSFEIRRYESSLFTSIKMPTNKYEDASNQGFGILAGYIFGGNDKNEKIAMTSPVSLSLTDSMTMMFMVPKSIRKEDLPAPNQSRIEFKEEPEKRVAAITFGGWADSERIETFKYSLMDFLDENGIAYTDRFFFLGYNAPFEIIGRKNEVIVELE